MQNDLTNYFMIRKYPVPIPVSSSSGISFEMWQITVSLRKILNLTSISKNMCVTTENTRKCILSIVYAHSFYVFFLKSPCINIFQKFLSNVLWKSRNSFFWKSSNSNLLHFETTFSTPIWLDSRAYFTYQIKSFLVQDYFY